MATADASPASQDCIGLDCSPPPSATYIPEAHGTVPSLASIDELMAQRESGFYRIPAIVFQGDVASQTVVYLSRPGTFDQVPRSMRSLPAVADFERMAGSTSTTTLIVIDRGISLGVPAGRAAVAAHGSRPKARAASWHGCLPRYFCLWGAEGFGGGWLIFYGPDYYGRGWLNLTGTYRNFGSSMVNYRDGDTLLADWWDGNSTRYCAQQQSEDSTFSNNPIGNGNTSSVALLGSTPDRC